MFRLRFSRGDGVAGAIVRFGTWSAFAHVGFKLENGLILDATPEKGVAYRVAEDDETTRYYELVDPPPGVPEKAILWARDQVHRPYDWCAIFGFLVRRDWRRENAWDCSEYIEGAFVQANWPLVRDSHHLNRITPRDLLTSERIRRVK